MFIEGTQCLFLQDTHHVSHIVKAMVWGELLLNKGGIFGHHCLTFL